MAPFVRKVRNGGGTAVQIVEKVGRTNRVVEHVGTAHDEAELAALVAAARERLHPDQGVLDVFATGSSAPGVIEAKRSRWLWEALEMAYAALGFDSAVGDEAFKQLVLARIVEPTSKADTLRVLDELGVEHASLRTLFNALERINRDGYRNRIATACFHHALSGGDLSLVLYDVTTLYFEAEKEDELRKVGYSKERRVDPQIVVGLLVDRAGFPLEVSCWEGNKAETQTILPTVKAFQERHGAHDMVVVADAG
ncbi:IS1634 family transposase, partial [Actinomyces culturomici]|uniref:IS1634 family transposase n=1 Tax=Actinomyces culturomici TaxID=1926276 RepID=UPI001357AB7D